MTTEILIGDCIESMKSLPSGSISACITSPPYFGLRRYLPEDHPDSDKEVGLEQTPEEFVQKMVDVFREVRRVLRDDGTCWVNLGTSYAGSGGARKEHHRNPVISKSFERDGYSGGKPANQSPQQQHVPACDSDGKESQGCQDHGCACHGQCDEHPGGTQTRHGRTAHNDQCAEQGSRPSLQTGRDTGHSGCEKEPLCASPLSSQGSSENASFEGSLLYESSPHHETEPPSFGQTSACATPGFSHKERSNPYKQRRSLISAVHIGGKEPFYTACHSPSCKGLGFCGLCWCSLSIPHLNVKPKDELNIPHLVAMALQADGWVLRQTIIWSKKNCMPESCTDRCTKSHEYVFLLTKSARYWYDAEAIKEGSTKTYSGVDYGGFTKKSRLKTGVAGNGQSHAPSANDSCWRPNNGRNKRSVWSISTTPYKNAHFATFPPKLIEPMILAGCPAKCCPFCGAGWVRVVEKESKQGQKEWSGADRKNGCQAGGGHKGRTGEWISSSKTLGFQPSCQCNAPDHVPGTVLDPFGGSGTTAYVANAYGRNAILCELNPEYEPLIRERLGMPYEVEQEERKPQQQEMF